MTPEEAAAAAAASAVPAPAAAAAAPVDPAALQRMRALEARYGSGSAGAASNLDTGSAAASGVAPSTRGKDDGEDVIAFGGW